MKSHPKPYYPSFVRSLKTKYPIIEQGGSQLKNRLIGKFILAGALLAAMPAAFLATGCTGPVSALTISIDPASATVVTGTSQQFQVYAGNEVITAGIVWEVNGVAGGNATFGTITANGLYTAPAAVPNPATVEINATQQGSAESLTATVTVTTTTPTTPAASIGVSPATISDGGTATLAWSSSGVTSCLINQSDTIAGIDVGTVGSASVSPSATTPYQLSCTGPNGPASATATLTVQTQTSSPITVAISPTTGSYPSGTVIQFSATVANDPSNAGVNWTTTLGPQLAVTGPLTATYTVPMVTVDTSILIDAVSAADTNATASASIIATPVGEGGGGGTGGSCTSPPVSQNPPQLGVSPQLINIAPGASQGFVSTITGDNVTNQAVTWSLKTTGDAAYIGTIKQTGPESATYIAAATPSLIVVQVVATSVQYTCVTGSSTVGVAP